jgi:hypothetical protein
MLRHSAKLRALTISLSQNRTTHKPEIRLAGPWFVHYLASQIMDKAKAQSGPPSCTCGRLLVQELRGRAWFAAD